MSTHRFAIDLLRVGCAAAMVLGFGCRSTPSFAPKPHESVLSIIAEEKIHLRYDPYRSQPGRTLAGQNIFRVSLARLDELDRLAGDDYRDIIAFARAQCYERLGQWKDAERAFGQVVVAGTSLADEADARAKWAAKIASIVAEPDRDIQGLDAYLNYLDLRLAKLEELRQTHPAFPIDSFLLIEIEETLEKKAYVLFGYRLPDPSRARAAIETARKLVDEHQASYRHKEHLLMLGQFYATLARDETTIYPPRGANFDREKWSRWIDLARDAFNQVAQADGDPAKPEGLARLRALEAYSLRTIQQAR